MRRTEGRVETKEQNEILEQLTGEKALGMSWGMVRSYRNKRTSKAEGT